MSVDREPTLGELKRESERTRAAFTDSVDDLRAKVNDTATEFKARIDPANIKEEVKDHLRSNGQEFVASLKRKASENPLQTLAIGAGLAYPLWKMLRSVPAPIMLVGAGFWLAHQKRNGSMEEDLTARASEQASNAAAAVHDAAIEGAEGFSRTAADMKAAASAGAQSLIDKVSGVASDAKTTASDIGQTLADKTASATDAAMQKASEFKEDAVALSRKSGNAILEFVERNPLLVAGAGLAVGAFVAASVPASNTENRFFGQSSDGLKDEVRRSVAAGVDQVKKVATDVMGDVADAAAQQGLSGEGLTNAVEGLTAGVKSVADKGLQALGGDNPDSSQQQQQPDNPSQRRF